jgi:hypothetical protein
MKELLEKLFNPLVVLVMMERINIYFVLNIVFSLGYKDAITKNKKYVGK